MEAKMAFRPKTDLQVKFSSSHPKIFEAKSSSFPQLTHLNQIFPRKQCVLMAKSSDHENIRPLIKFSPSIWGDYFLSVSHDDSELEDLEKEINALKPRVRDRLVCSDGDLKEKIRLIHLLVCLGLSYHFENEIEEILNRAFINVEDLIADENDLRMISVMFEVFRLYGHKMPCDVFRRFKGGDGEFKKCLVEDVRGMLSLYEAAHLGTPNEDIMDEAISFTSSHLESLAGQASTRLSKHMLNALHQPRYLNVEILVAREYISFYEQEEDHDAVLLKFAKLNFKFCQMHYRQELKTLTRWCKDLDITAKLPHVRDRIVETHFSATAMYFEPRYSLGRVIMTKIIAAVVAVDDTCDAYGTLSEVTSLVECVQRWDRSHVDELPSYLKTTKSLVKGYGFIAKWARKGHVPTFEEYMEVGLMTAGMEDMVGYSIIGMDEIDEKKAIEWLRSKPKIIHALNVMFRMRNDMATFEQEMSRGEVANGLNCYMKQHGVTEDEASEAFERMFRDNYMIVMEEFLDASSVQRCVLCEH